MGGEAASIRTIDACCMRFIEQQHGLVTAGDVGQRVVFKAAHAQPLRGGRGVAGPVDAVALFAGVGNRQQLGFATAFKDGAGFGVVAPELRITRDAESRPLGQLEAGRWQLHPDTFTEADVQSLEEELNAITVDSVNALIGGKDG
mgnify:CR=1 FL=1